MPAQPYLDVRFAGVTTAGSPLRRRAHRCFASTTSRSASRPTTAGITVVDGISFAIGAGDTLGLVGESGCGKSVTAQTLMRLLPMPPARIASGEHAVLMATNLVTASERRLRELRGDRIAMIFQEPMTSLNPTFTVGSQIAEVLRLHRGLSQR